VEIGGRERLGHDHRVLDPLAHFPAGGGNEHDRDAPPVADRLHGRNAGAVRQPYVRGDQIRVVRLGRGHRIRRGFREVERVAAEHPQMLLYQEGDDRMILDDQGMHGQSTSGSRSGSTR